MKFLTISAAATLLSLIHMSQALPAAAAAAANRPVCQETHLVTAQETCQSIAAKYGQPKSDIEQWTKKFNGQFDCNKLKVGESICVKYGEGSIDKRGLKHDKKPIEKKPKHPKHPKPTTTTLQKKPAPKDDNHEQGKPINKRAEQDDKHVDDEKRTEEKPVENKPVEKKPKHPKTTTATHHEKPAPTPAPKNVGQDQGKPINKRSEQDMKQAEKPVDEKPAEKKHTEKKPAEKKPKHHKTTTTTHHKKPAPTPAPKDKGREEDKSINKRGEQDDKKPIEKKPKHKTTTTVKKPLPKKTLHKKKHASAKKEKKTQAHYKN